MNNDGAVNAALHIVSELGLLVDRVGDEIHGSAAVVPEMFVPGTTSIRTSILAAWTDVLSGLLAVDLVAPRVPVTLDLDVHLHAPPRALGTISGAARMLKAGRSVVVAAVTFTGSGGETVASGTASFMTAPDPALTLPLEKMNVDALPRQAGRLRLPFAERARCEIREPGVATLPRSEDGVNVSNTVSGALTALAVEEAALSLTPGATLSSMAMRFLRPVRVGPAVASAHMLGGLGSVEVRDAGSNSRLAVFATTETFGYRL